MLLEMQRAFKATVMGTGDADAVAALVRAPKGDVSRRIAVYRNTVQKSLTDVLAAAFPVTERIVGPRFFFVLARDYAVQFPPEVPQLSVYGAGFADFIAHHPRTQGLAYLPDVARLEWARGETYFAADAPPLNAAWLSAFGPEQLPQARFVVHPATRLVRSAYPIHRIWSVNQPEVAEVPAVDMAAAQSVLLTRPVYDVGLRLLSEADAAFVAACAAGATLNDAAVAALAVDEGFDLQAALQEHFRQGTFTDVVA
ncbi:MAG: putative DNA-binding domain-containing protein [Rhodospirillaceae bacterium]|nr:putative DNA-binding domain-containing protein [Rhodospirillaceae bacterium]